MLPPPVEQRVTDLEELMADLLRAQARTQTQIELTSREMREFQSEMSNFKEESNKRWGELANRLGTLAEDLVAPSIPRILRTVVPCPEGELDSSAVRVRRRLSADSGRSHEFDVVASCGDYLLLNETKPRLNTAYIDQFVQTLEGARAFFPEHADKKIIGAIAALYLDLSLVHYGEKAGLLVLGLGEDLMDVLNSPGFVPREF